jgi:hypothetical protein
VTLDSVDSHSSVCGEGIGFPHLHPLLPPPPPTITTTAAAAPTTTLQLLQLVVVLISSSSSSKCYGPYIAILVRDV